jgi:hypothetical protein
MWEAFWIPNQASSFRPNVPIVDWEFGDSGLVGAALSRRVLSIEHQNYGRLFSLEVEAGIGQRFGDLTETEFWGALYGRWHAFPWNRWVSTTVGLSTGVNWATGIPNFEVARSGNGQGSQLLHYLSPEITFALPDHPSHELVLRFHHRSGGRGVFGDNALFNNTGGGAQYGTIGCE